MRSGVEVDLRTINGDIVPTEGFRFSSARDVANLKPGEPIYTMQPRTGLPPFEKIQKIDFKNNILKRVLIGSNPDQLEYYQMGNTRYSVPPPPDWFRRIDHSAAWHRTAPIDDSTVHPFLNHSISCWVDTTQSGNPGEGPVYLFRQAFNLKNTTQIARARMRMATNAEFREGWLNEHPIHTGYGSGIAEFEITTLLRDGTNILAFQLGEQQTTANRRYSLSFHIEITTRQPGQQGLHPGGSAALLTTDLGDRVLGQVHTIQGGQVKMDTGYGPYAIPWEQCTGLIFPEGWASSGPDTRDFQFFSSHKEANQGVKNNLYAMPVRTFPPSLGDSILLTNMRKIMAKPTYVTASKLHVEDIQGNHYTIPTREVLAIYPPRPIRKRMRRPQQPAAVLYCRVKTIHGEEISGWLLELNGGRVMMETANHDRLLIKPHWIRDIHFPYHAAPISENHWKESMTLGILAQIDGQESYQPLYTHDSMAARAAAFSLGMSSRTISAESLLATGGDSPRDHPVLIYIDPIGEFMHTRDGEGDVQRALIDYIFEGGVLIVLSRGGAFRTAVVNKGSRLARKPSHMIMQPLNEKLRIITLQPGHHNPKIARAFDRPPNHGSSIYFQRTGRIPRALSGLPRRIMLSPMVSAPFYPMTSSEGDGTVIYSLEDDNGSRYGPSLTMLQRGRGHLVLIDHLIWDSKINERPFSERILPVILHWALNINSS